MRIRWSLGIWLCVVFVPSCVLAQPSTNVGGKIQFAESVHDFGQIRAGETVKYSFVFTNVGAETLRINSVQPSCGCTATADWSRTVEPGQTGSIPIQFNSGSFNGQVTKTVSVNSTDKTQHMVVLQIKATIWRPVDVSPQFAVINVPPDVDGGSAVINIVNNTDEPITFAEPESNHRAFRAVIEPGTNGPKHFQMIVSTVPPISTGNVQGQITVKTTSTNVPVITVTAWANVQPALVVLPGQMTLPAPPLANPITPSVLIQNNSTNSLKITEPSINAENVEINIRETQPGRQYSVALTFPAGFEVKPGQQIVFTAKTSHPSMPEIKVPISQMPRPITIPPAAPAAADGPGRDTHAAIPPAAPHQFPMVPAR